MKKTFSFALALTMMSLCSVFSLHAQFSGGGSGTASDPFKIKTADDLNNVRNYVGSGYDNVHFRLMNNIDLTALLGSSTEGWLPIGDNSRRFVGYFHGGGYKVNGLWINRTTIGYVGFFGFNSGTIDSLIVTVTAKNISGGAYTGGFVGYNEGIITECGVEGGSSVTISGTEMVGGFAGNNSNKLFNCYATISSSSSSSSYSYSGGFVGQSSGTITNCYATGSSSSSSSSSTYSGGFVGYSSYGTITNCYATGSSSSSSSYSDSYSGGFVGQSSGTITNCYATGSSSSSSSSSFSGGFVGQSSGTITNCYATGSSSSSSSFSGGFVGQSSGTITNCYAMGNSSSSFRSGGFVGYSYGTITNCYATGSSSSSSSSSFSGGFVGYLDSGKISNSYSVGEVTSYGTKGAFAGYCANTTYLSQCYYNSDITGSMSSVGNNVGNNNALGATTANMKLKATFINWDFDTIWTIEEGLTYPYFHYIDGLIAVCPNSTHTYFTYPDKSNYVWTVSNGSILSGQSSHKVTVKWNNNANPSSISVVYDGIEKMKKEIKLFPFPGITGNMNPLTGNTEYYTTEDNMSDYVWTVTGGEITYGQGTNWIRVQWNCSTGAGHVTVNYTNGNGCTASAATDSIVNKRYIPPTISGELQPYIGATASYTTESGMSDYTWVVTGGEIVSGQGTRNISIKWNCAVGSGKVSVNYANSYGCYAAVPVDSIVSLKPVPILSISGEKKPTIGYSEYYFLEGTASNFSWSAVNGEILSGQGTQEVEVLWKSTSGKLKVQYANEYGCSAQSEFAVNPIQLFGGGIGTQENPFLIKTARHLYNIGWPGDKYYRLANDIDLTDFITEINNEKKISTGWVRPGLSSSAHFDGNYHTISGLWVDDPGWNNIGLFNYNEGVIEKLYVKIAGKGITAGYCVGGLVGYNSGTISECAVIEGNVTALKNSCGGLCGYNEGVISRSYANCTVWGDVYVGGLVGYVPYFYSNSKVSQCYSLSTVVGSSEIGGLIGYLGSSVSQSYAAGIVSGGNFAGGFLGYNDEGIITGCYYDREASQLYNALGNSGDSQAKNVSAKYTSDMMKKNTFLAWDFNNVWKINELESYPYFQWQEFAPVPYGIAQISENSLRIYPNPTSGIVMIECEPNSLLQIYNLSGKMIYQTTSVAKKEIIDLGAYPAGMYLIKVGNQYARVIKK